MSGWETPHARWGEWIERDTALQHPVWVSCDEFDDNLRNLLEARPFAESRSRDAATHDLAAPPSAPAESAFSPHSIEHPAPDPQPTVFSAEAATAEGAAWSSAQGAAAWAIDAPAAHDGGSMGVAPALSEPELEGLFIPALTRPALEVATAPQGAPTPLPILDFSSELPLAVVEDEAVPVPAHVDAPAIEAPRIEPASEMAEDAAVATEPAADAPEPMAPHLTVLAPVADEALAADETPGAPEATEASVPAPVAVAPEVEHAASEAPATEPTREGWRGPAFVHHAEPEEGAVQAISREPESAAIELDEAEFVEEHEFQEVQEAPEVTAAERKGPPAPPPVREDASDDAPRETAAALAVLQADRDSLSAAELEQRVAQAPAPGAPWYEEVFGEHFAALTRPSHGRLAQAEVDFFLSIAGLRAGARVVDVGCGDGAHAIVLAQRGFEVTGLDLSASQLLRAAKAADALHAPVRWVHDDMRRASVIEPGSMDALVCFGTTFGYFDEEENRRVLQRWRDWLVPHGRALLQVANRDHVIARLPARSWWQGRNCLVLDESEMDFFTNRLHVQRNIAFNDGRQYKHDMSIRVYSAYELGHMCAAAGFRVVEISGSRHTRSRFYGATSPEIWLLVERMPS